MRNLGCGTTPPALWNLNQLVFVYGYTTLIVGGTATPVALNTLPQVPWHSVLTASVEPFSSRITSWSAFRSCLISAHSNWRPWLTSVGSHIGLAKIGHFFPDWQIHSYATVFRLLSDVCDSDFIVLQKNVVDYKVISPVNLEWILSATFFWSNWLFKTIREKKFIYCEIQHRSR